MDQRSSWRVFCSRIFSSHLTPQWPNVYHICCDVWTSGKPLCLSCRKQATASQVLYEPIGIAGRNHAPNSLLYMAATINQSLVHKQSQTWQSAIFFSCFPRSTISWGRSYGHFRIHPGMLCHKRPLAARFRFSSHGCYTLQCKASRTDPVGKFDRKWRFAWEKSKWSVENCRIIYDYIWLYGTISGFILLINMGLSIIWDCMGISIVMEVPLYRWMVFVRDTPKQKWMMTRGTPSY